MKLKIKRVIALLLSIIMTFSFMGCSTSEITKDEKKVGRQKAASVVNGSLEKDSIVIAVGDTKVTYGEYKVYSYLLQSKYEATLNSDIWKYSLGEERTIGTEAIEEIIRLIIQLKIIGRTAEEGKVVLAVDENEEISFDADNYFKKIPDEDKVKYGITVEILKSVLTDNVLARMMYDIVTGSVNSNISAEEEKIAKVQMIYLMSKGTDKNNKKIDLDATGKTALYQEANKLLNKVKKKGSFYTVAEKKSSISKIDFDLGMEDEPKEISEVALKMKKGEVSDIISLENGYYIIYCISNSDKEAVKAHREALILERQTKAFQDKYEEWAKKYEVNVSESLLERELIG